MKRSEVPIADPCPRATRWDDMPGDARRRFCDSCDRHVHDLSAMTEQAARELVHTRHVCVRYTFDRRGRLLHLPALAAGAMLATSAGAAPMVSEAPPDVTVTAAPATGWLPWLAERLPQVLRDRLSHPSEPVPPIVLRQVVLRQALDTGAPEPHHITGGVPRRPPPTLVAVWDRTGHAQLESSCCGQTPLRAGRAEIFVGDVGYIELVGSPSSRTKVRAGDEVLCTEIDGQVACRVQ